MKGKIAVCINDMFKLFKEGVIVSEKDYQGVTCIDFGSGHIEGFGGNMFVLKEDMVDSLNGINKGDVKYFIWDDKIYKVKIMFLIKANQNRYQHVDEDGFIGKCSPRFFGRKYILDQPISELINTKEEANSLIS